MVVVSEDRGALELDHGAARADQPTDLGKVGAKIHDRHVDEVRGAACHPTVSAMRRKCGSEVSRTSMSPRAGEEPGALRNGAPFNDWLLPPAIIFYVSHNRRAGKGGPDNMYIQIALEAATGTVQSYSEEEDAHCSREA